MSTGYWHTDDETDCGPGPVTETAERVLVCQHDRPVEVWPSAFDAVYGPATRAALDAFAAMPLVDDVTGEPVPDRLPARPRGLPWPWPTDAEIVEARAWVTAVRDGAEVATPVRLAVLPAETMLADREGTLIRVVGDGRFASARWIGDVESLTPRLPLTILSMPQETR